MCEELPSNFTNSSGGEPRLTLTLSQGNSSISQIYYFSLTPREMVVWLKVFSQCLNFTPEDIKAALEQWQWKFINNLEGAKNDETLN